MGTRGTDDNREDGSQPITSGVSATGRKYLKPSDSLLHPLLEQQVLVASWQMPLLFKLPKATQANDQQLKSRRENAEVTELRKFDKT